MVNVSMDVKEVKVGWGFRPISAGGEAPHSRGCASVPSVALECSYAQLLITKQFTSHYNISHTPLILIDYFPTGHLTQLQSAFRKLYDCSQNKLHRVNHADYDYVHLLGFPANRSPERMPIRIIVRSVIIERGD